MVSFTSWQAIAMEYETVACIWFFDLGKKVYMFFRLRTLPKQLWDRTPRSSSLHNQNIDFVTCIIQPITLFHEKILRIAHKNEVKQKTGGDLRVRLINCVLIAKFRLLYR